MRWHSSKQGRFDASVARCVAKRQWHIWFAWHPIIISDEWVWWEFVERRYRDGFFFDPWEYRNA